MIHIIIIISILIMLSIASAYDIKWRYIPDYISYSFISISIVERVLYAIEENNINLLTMTLPAVIILGGISYLLYKSGMWGGGDFKIIISVAILLAGFKGEVIPAFIDFFINLMIVGALYILPITLFIGLRKLKPTKKERLLLILGGLSAMTIIIYPSISIFLLSIGIFIVMSLPYLKRIEDKCFIKPANMKTLMDGDWLINEIKVGKKIIKPKKEGLTYEEAELIKKWWAEGKLKEKPLIKEGIAYLPAFLITMIFTLLFGNIIILLVAEGLKNSSEIISMLS